MDSSYLSVSHEDIESVRVLYVQCLQHKSLGIMNVAENVNTSNKFCRGHGLIAMLLVHCLHAIHSRYYARTDMDLSSLKLNNKCARILYGTLSWLM